MTEEKTSSRVHDLFGAILGVFALAMLVSSRWQIDTSGPDPFYKGPLIFPLIVCCLMLAGSLWRLFKPVRNASWHLDGQGKPIKGIFILGLLMIYIPGIMAIGMELSTWLFLMIGLKLVKQDSVLKLTAIPIVVTLILYLVFKVFLDVWFPEPLIMGLFLE